MKTTILAFCLVLLGYTGLYSQSTQAISNSDKVYTIVQEKPQFRGDINKYLADKIMYPADAREKNIQGTVYASFIVERDGSVSTVKVVRSVYTSLDNEAVRVISAMPKWTPGSQNGHPVRVQYMVPIRFILADNSSSNLKKN